MSERGRKTIVIVPGSREHNEGRRTARRRETRTPGAGELEWTGPLDTAGEVRRALRAAETAVLKNGGE